MVRLLAIAVPLSALFNIAQSWAPSAVLSNTFSTRSQQHIVQRSITTSLPMAIDYNDPAVAEEFAKIQPMTFEEVEEELLEKGIRGNASMNEMDLKLMLVEVRMRFAGKMPGQNSSASEKKKPAKYSSKFEEAMWEKPKFAELYNELKKKDDHNAMNVVTEYLSDQKIALQRYGKDYKRLLKNIEAALNAKEEVKSPKISFRGFPANMGEMGCKMTLEALGAVVDFECSESEDFPILVGTATFEDIESAKKCIEQYDGMNMGMGESLQILSIA